MNTIPTITRIDHNDPKSQAALASEQRLFAHYGLDYKVHFVEMQEPNLRVRVLEIGTGKPLLLIPGGAGDAFAFSALIAHLKGYRVIAINRPGGGLSDGLDHRGVNVRELAVNTVKSVADAFGLERVPVICNSMGGLWGLWYTLAYPEKVSQLVELGCPALVLNTSAPFLFRLLSVPGINSLIAPNMSPKKIENVFDGLRSQGSYQEDIDSMPSVAAEATYHFFNLPTYQKTWVTLISEIATLAGAKPKYQLRADELQKVKPQTLFLWGDNDVFGGLDVARQVVSHIPNAQLHEMHTGHLPYIDKPQECGEVIMKFLSKG